MAPEEQSGYTLLRTDRISEHLDCTVHNRAVLLGKKPNWHIKMYNKETRVSPNFLMKASKRNRTLGLHLNNVQRPLIPPRHVIWLDGPGPPLLSTSGLCRAAHRSHETQTQTRVWVSGRVSGECSSRCSRCCCEDIMMHFGSVSCSTEPLQQRLSATTGWLCHSSACVLLMISMWASDEFSVEAHMDSSGFWF